MSPVPPLEGVAREHPVSGEEEVMGRMGKRQVRQGKGANAVDWGGTYQLLSAILINLQKKVHRQKERSMVLGKETGITIAKTKKDRRLESPS